MARIGSLEVQLGIDKTSFDNGIRGAAQKLDQMEGSVDKAGRKLDEFGGKLGRAGGLFTKFASGPIAAAGAGAIAFAQKFTAAGDQLAKTADKLGVSTDALQELRFAAERGGVASSALDTSVQRLARRTAEAAQGSGTLAKVLEEYGIAATDAAGNARPVEEMLVDIADAMDGASSQGEKLRIAIAAFDTEGAGMVNVLAGGAAGMAELREEARALGGVIGEDTLRQSEAFQDNMTNMQARLGAATNAIGAALIPALNDLIPVLVENVIPAVVSMAESVGSAITWFSELPVPVQEAGGIIAAVLGAGGPVLLALGVLSKALGALVIASGPIGLFIAAATALYIAWQTWGEDITELVTSTVGWLTERFTVFSEFITELWTRLGETMVMAFSAPLETIKEMVTTATGAIGDAFQWLGERLVWGSIVPDMMDDMEAQFRRLDGMVSMNQGAANAISRTWERNSDDQSKAIARGASEATSILGQFFEDSKALGIAQALINTWIGVSQTLATYPWPLSGVLAALHAAAGLATVASIQSTTRSGGGGRSGGGVGGGGGGAAAAAAPQPTQNQTVTVQGLDRDQLFSGDQIVELLNEAQKRGARIVTTG